MSWLKRYHDDHMSVLTLLAGLEGNIKDFELGLDRPYMMTEFEEIGKIIKEIIIPHFHNEEKNIYPKVAEKDEDGKTFINNMLEEHQQLYATFEDYLHALENNDKQKLMESGKIIVNILRGHIIKEEKYIPYFLKVVD